MPGAQQEGADIGRKKLDYLVPRVNPTQQEKSSERDGGVRQAGGQLAYQDPGHSAYLAGEEAFHRGGTAVDWDRAQRLCCVA